MTSSLDKVLPHDAAIEQSIYVTPERIPRDSLDFSIAQLEQISRIRFEALESEEGINRVRTEAISRVIDCYRDYEERQEHFLESSEQEYRLAHLELQTTELSLGRDLEYNRFVAALTYHRLTGNEPQGELCVVATPYLLHFITDNAENFPHPNPHVTGGLLRTRNAQDPELNRLKISYAIREEMPTDLSETGVSRVLEEEEEGHAIGEIVQEELGREGYVWGKGGGLLSRALQTAGL